MSESKPCVVFVTTDNRGEALPQAFAHCISDSPGSSGVATFSLISA